MTSLIRDYDSYGVKAAAILLMAHELIDTRLRAYAYMHAHAARWRSRIGFFTWLFCVKSCVN